MEKIIFEEISQAAKERNPEKVRLLLSKSPFDAAIPENNFRFAARYAEMFHDQETADFIRSNSKCECGQPAIKLHPEPICRGCNIKRSLNQIQYL